MEQVIRNALLNRIAFALEMINEHQIDETNERYSCIVCNLTTALESLERINSSEE